MNFDKPILVTGGGGFLGAKICSRLIEKGYRVRSFSRKSYPELNRIGVDCVQGDLRDGEAVRKAVKGCGSVIHNGAIAGIWGRKDDYLGINVQGTRNVLDASKAFGVRELVYTSSPSVVARNDDLSGADESLAYSDKFYSWYSYSKKQAESLILNAHGEEGLCAVALRPHLIWGPGDPHFLPRILEKARQKKLFRLGNTQNLVDVIFVDNAANAHISALEAMTNGQFIGGGQAFFLGQEKPVNLWDFLDKLLLHSGEKPLSPHPKLTFKQAWSLGFIIEGLYKTLRIYDRDPPMTRFLAMQLCRSHFFSHANAANHIGYHPEISIEQGLSLLKKSFNSH